MNYLIDTNICIYIINKHPQSVIERFRTLDINAVGISEITVSELSYGVAKSQRKKENTQRLEEFLLPFTVLPYRSPAAKSYAQIRAGLESQGQTIGSLDMLIAAQAIAENLTLVTNNIKEFQRVGGLTVENWV